jgi:hypothetical protein
MTEKPTFEPKMNKAGSWFVAVETGHGPESHIGDFPTEQEALRWISTKSKDWPHPVDISKWSQTPPGAGRNRPLADSK